MCSAHLHVCTSSISKVQTHKHTLLSGLLLHAHSLGSQQTHSICIPSSPTVYHFSGLSLFSLLLSTEPPHQPPRLLTACFFACRRPSHRQGAPVKWPIPRLLFIFIINSFHWGTWTGQDEMGLSRILTGRLSQPVTVLLRWNRIGTKGPPGRAVMNASHHPSLSPVAALHFPPSLISLQSLFVL